MLLLASVSDQLTLVTGGTTNIDVHVSYLDYQSATGVEAVTPGRQNTLITTATTTVILSPPGDATTYRRAKALSIRNRDTNTTNTVTVKHTDGTNNVEIISVPLSAGDELFYDGAGWFLVVASGGVVSVLSPTLSAAVIDFAASGDNTVISAVASRTIKVFRLFLVVAAPTNITFQSNTTKLSGAIPLTVAGASISMTDEGILYFQTTGGQAFKINSSNAVQVSGTVWYIQH